MAKKHNALKEFRAFEEAAQAFSHAEALVRAIQADVQRASEEIDRIRLRAERDITVRETALARFREELKRALEMAGERQKRFDETEAKARTAGVTKGILKNQKKIYDNLMANEAGTGRPHRGTTAPKVNSQYPDPPENKLYFTREELAKHLKLKLHQIDYLHRRGGWGSTVYSGRKIGKKVPWYAYTLEDLPEKYRRNPAIIKAWSAKEKKAAPA